MRAIIHGPSGQIEDMRIAEWEQPRPGPEEVLIRVAAAGVNRADLLQRQGKYPPPPGASPVLGLEVSGVIEAAGADCRLRSVGEEVCCLLPGGGYAEYVALHEELALPIPSGVDLVSAAAIPEAFLTAWQALVLLGQLEAGDRVLIHAGASGVGTAAIQLARELGAFPLVTASAGKHGLCMELGAMTAIDYAQEDFSERALRYTAGEGVDLLLDFIGSAYTAQNLRSLAVDGRWVLLGLMGGAVVRELDLGQMLRKRIHLKASTLRNRSLEYKIALSAALQAFAWPHFAEGRLRPVIDSVWDWAEAAEAHRRMEANLSQGKILLRVS
jgi:putative PIG3 family NAD(P)H quinone oxidoreductase